jgi:hypothetical protein
MFKKIFNYFSFKKKEKEKEIIFDKESEQPYNFFNNIPENLAKYDSGILIEFEYKI